MGSRDGFGDTALLVMEMGRDLAKRLGQGSALLMRGHGAVIASGSIRQAVFVSVYLERTFSQDAVGGDQLVDDVFQLGHILSLTPWLLSPRPR